MWYTSGGNTGSSFSAAWIVPPDETDWRTLSIAFSTTWLPDVLPVTLIASSIGTPAVTSEDSVRDQRARAIFWTMSPIFIGVRSRIRSHWARPLAVAFQRRNMKSPPPTMMIGTNG